jgi:hypothetical protein
VFNRRNALSIVTVVIGIVSLCGVPQKLGLTSEQVIMGLLSFVALESIIINIDYLEHLRDAAEEVRGKVVRPGLDALFRPRSGRFDLGEAVQDAREVLVCGVSLESMVMSQASLFAQLARQRCRIRFVTADPEARLLDGIDANMANYVGGEVVRGNVRAGLARLASLYQGLSDAQRTRMEVRTYVGIPYYSAVRILRRGETGDTIWTSFYTYGGATGERRGILIDSRSSPQTFAFYRDSLDRLWASSEEVDLAQYVFGGQGGRP